jgi:phosphoglycolate phosphatase
MHLLFDLDGTLSDPFHGITKSIQHALRSMGLDVPAAEDLRWCIGPPLHDSFHVLLEGTDPKLFAETLAHYRERYSTIGLFENELYSGIVDCLRELSQEGHSLRIATSKPTVFAKRIIDHFELTQYFNSVNGSELDGIRSDKTQLISHIVERDQLNPKDVIMVGDRKFDMIGANNNGIPAIGVLWGFGSIDELQAAGARKCVAKAALLPAAIKEIAEVD